jgi:eukaryotic-like serine/threonine-protein kinase
MEIAAKLPADQWERAKEMFAAAVHAPEHERRELVMRACGEDSRLASEILDLLQSNESVGEFLDTPAAIRLELGLPHLSGQSLAPGEVLGGRFRIVRFLNRGGMGEVYEAWDQELAEAVALKIIRPEIASHAGVIERFKQEVKRARGVTHPNVCRVYDLFVDTASGATSERTWFLTMQLLEGESLAERLRRKGPMTAQEALPLVAQIVAGLAAAHVHGVVHLDFKSANVMLARHDDGRLRAVITDFGLAVSLSEVNFAERETWGGTPAYMAPEQMRGEKTGEAADQFALGIVLCEMLTGMRPLRKLAGAENKAIYLSLSYLPGTVPWPRDGASAGLGGSANGETSIELPAAARIPARWGKAIRRCLRENPEKRFPSVTDILPSLRFPQMLRRRLLALSAAVVIAAAAVGAISAASGSRWYADRLVMVSQLTSPADLSGNPSFSHDGKTIVYDSDRANPGVLSIWMQRLPDGAPVALTDPAEQAYDPDISPDGTGVVFESKHNPPGIYWVSAAGGPPRLLVRDGMNPKFSPDGREIAYDTGSAYEGGPKVDEIYRLPLAGGPAVAVTSSSMYARAPRWSSDGRYILFQGGGPQMRPRPEGWDWWVVSADGSNLYETGAVDIQRQAKTAFDSLDTWQDNQVLYDAEQDNICAVWALQISKRTLQARGVPHRLTEPGTDRNFCGTAIAPDGSAAIVEQNAGTHVWRITPPSPLLPNRRSK